MTAELAKVSIHKGRIEKRGKPPGQVHRQTSASYVVEVQMVLKGNLFCWRKTEIGNQPGIDLKGCNGDGLRTVLLSRMCAKVRTVLFLPRRVLLTTVVSDRRDFPDYGGDGPRRSAAIAGRTRHG